MEYSDRCNRDSCGKKAKTILFREKEKAQYKNTRKKKAKRSFARLFQMDDFRLFKESKVHILPSIKVLGESGYRGLQKIHANVELPHRKTKKHPLTFRKMVQASTF